MISEQYRRGKQDLEGSKKLKAVGLKRAKDAVSAAEHSIASKEGATAARPEIRMLIEDYESGAARLQEIMRLIESPETEEKPLDTGGSLP